MRRRGRDPSTTNLPRLSRDKFFAQDDIFPDDRFLNLIFDYEGMNESDIGFDCDGE